jgi:hypothetical protein
LAPSAFSGFFKWYLPFICHTYRAFLSGLSPESSDVHVFADVSPSSSLVLPITDSKHLPQPGKYKENKLNVLLTMHHSTGLVKIMLTLTENL